MSCTTALTRYPVLWFIWKDLHDHETKLGQVYWANLCGGVGNVGIIRIDGQILTSMSSFVILLTPHLCYVSSFCHYTISHHEICEDHIGVSEIQGMPWWNIPAIPEQKRRVKWIVANDYQIKLFPPCFLDFVLLLSHMNNSEMCLLLLYCRRSRGDWESKSCSWLTSSSWKWRITWVLELML